MLIVARPQIQEESITPTRSRFAIEPLQPGFGYTLGNALRRTLLSSIPGAAISSVRIDGVLHEFSQIPKITEDVTDIILNLKQLVLRSEVDEPVTAYLKAKGPADVTAGDIQPPAGVEVLNTDLHIATLGRGASLELELFVQRGVGYVPAERNKNPRDPIGVIPVDSIFSPVRRVTYTVENTRVEQMTDRDRRRGGRPRHRVSAHPGCGDEWVDVAEGGCRLGWNHPVGAGEPVRRAGGERWSHGG